MLSRNSSVNSTLAWICYVAGATLSVINISFTMDFFLNYLSSGNPGNVTGASWWGCAMISVAMAAYEGVMVGIVFTPQVWNFILQLPLHVRQMDEAQRDLVEKGIKVAIVLSLLLLFWVYWIDIFSTLGRIGDLQGFQGWNNAPNAARFLAIGLVVFPEILYSMGNAAMYLSQVGRAQQKLMREMLNRAYNDR